MHIVRRMRCTAQMPKRKHVFENSPGDSAWPVGWLCSLSIVLL